MIFKRQAVIDRARRFFTDKRDAIDLPELIEVQKTSYNWFLEKGLRELFSEVSPITDFSGRDLELYFDDYYLDEPKFEEKVCREKKISYEAPLRVKARLINKRTDSTHDQEVYLGDIPTMTTRGTFIINGIERVIVSQLIRSAGAYFMAETLRGRRYYGAKIIPNRGAWIEIETDRNNVIWAKVDRRRKVSITSLMRAFGYSTDEQIREALQDVNTHPNIDYVTNSLEKDTATNEEEGLVEVYKRIRPGDLATPDNARSLVHAMFSNFSRYDLSKVGVYKLHTRFDIPFKDGDLESVENRILKPETLVKVVREVIRLNVTQDEPDDIDHLGNRRIRAVGELVQSRFRVGLARMERIVTDRMSTYDIDTISPARLINARPVIGAVREFFMSSQLSQFMDQTNPLSELEHKRRVSALGPGGLSRDRAGFEVRDVHPTHYGRICPIATPEGPNIGLVGHLSSFARINEFGFVETPYRVVEKDEQGRAQVTNEVVYLNAFKEEKSITASSTTPVDDQGYFTQSRAGVRKYGEPNVDDSNNIQYLDVASNQIVSVATSLIPFLEHDDATRALMGTNMQRQAVPCIRPDAPIIGTGIEARSAGDSGYVVQAAEDGEIIAVDGAHVVLKGESGTEYKYEFIKYLRSNQSTCITQRPVVSQGAKVKKGDVLVDGPSIDQGELALGQNLLVAYMIWDGYNYEDAIIISERLVRDDRFTSIHIESYTTDVRETKLGPEVITSDIPNVSEERLRNLDSEGIVRMGAEVRPGDILVGKITPKGETDLSPEERLLRAIFGEKARDVRDSSLYLKHGEHGKVIGIKIFSAEEGDKLQPGVTRQVEVTVADMRKVQVGDKLAGRHGNKGVISRVVPAEDMPFLEDGTPIDIILSPLGVISRMNLGQLLETHLGLAANAQGYHVATPVLNGVTEQQIKAELEAANLPVDGQIQLYDGRTGEPFDRKTTVGYNYILKLNHMVDDKIHQRSIGPYSLITQQPLGGKAQHGGQRFGEMEVWALEAYGAAQTLQEILTIKSDDVQGRARAYEAIIKGEDISRVNIPESFHVLTRELKGLGLDIELLRRSDSGKMSKVEQPQYEKDPRTPRT